MTLAIIATLIIFEALLVIVHLAVYAALAAAFGIGGVWLKALFVVLAVTFVSASFLSHFYKSAILDWYYRFSAYWFGLVHFLFGAAVIFFFTLALLYASDTYVAPALVGAVCFGALFFLHLYGTWNSQRARVTRVRVPFSPMPGFRADFWKGKTIVFVSDFQLGNVFRAGFTARAVKKIQGIAPYAVFIGGDLYDGVVCDDEKIIAPLRELHAPGGVYFITGNHEYYLRDVPRALAAVRAAGITVLDDKKADVGGIDLIGVDYQSAHKKDDFKKVLDRIGVDPAKPTILLKHEPTDLGIAEAAGVSLTLSGHTHHGQIWPLNFFTWQIYKGFDYGLKKLGAMQVFTSSGLGTWGPPLRLGTRSEIVAIELI